ncbi:MAG TPA: pyridoxal-phosphate dependent enzyme [Gemmatimonadaceae bacterium]
MLPLIERFPTLDGIPRASLCTTPTPVTRLDALANELWIKRDDLSANPIGGNKVRALEFLFGGLTAGSRVVTVGSAGSTHALSVATFATALGLDVRVGRWRQEMNHAAECVSMRTEGLATRAPVFSSVPTAYAWALWQKARGAKWIPAGGSSPLGILGHVNAGLELVQQIERGVLPEPRTVVVPLGTGGTMAGLALAFAIAERRIRVVGVRVVPRIVANERHVHRLVNGTAKLIERLVGSKVKRPNDDAIQITHGEYGGAYGRETNSARMAAEHLDIAHSIRLDATYSAKAFAQTLTLANAASTAPGPTLFWLTFDARTLDSPRP